MKTLLSIFSVFLVSLFFISCGKFSDGGSVWQEGMWLIPSITGAGSVVFWYLTYKEWKVGGTGGYQKIGGVDKWVEDNERFPVYKAAYFWFAVALTIATVGIIIWVNVEK